MDWVKNGIKFYRVMYLVGRRSEEEGEGEELEEEGWEEEGEEEGKEKEGEG